MKTKARFLLVIAGLVLLGLGCSETNSILNPPTVDQTKLVPPLGLRAEAQSGKVTLFWYTSNYEKDFGGYFVYKANGDLSQQSNDTTLSRAFSRVDSLGLKAPIDQEISRTISGLTNGTTYSFAIVAFADQGKKISYPSNIVAVVPNTKVVTVKEKLSPPLGLHSVTGNGQVTLFWYTSNYEPAFQGYYIFKAKGDFTNQSVDSTLSSQFTLADSLPISGNSDKLVTKTLVQLTNGQTYSFAVVAYAYWGEQISYPSNIIKDTPRPEITSITVKSASTNQVTGVDAQAGFDFNTFKVVSVPVTGYINDNGSDLINEAYDPSAAGQIRPWLAGMNGAGLQDLGYMDALSEADFAPEKGYSDPGKSIAVLAGHVYAIKTGDNHYGKLIITTIGSAPDYSVTFNAAFQTVAGDRNYKALPDIKSRLGIH
ncbi:hypothetical protein L0128_14790 [candidate division KSB1 bacterium]|nr:hypothetical protein [candidate division KSB1 bacterium]